MVSAEDVLRRLKREGHKLTAGRKAIIEMFVRNPDERFSAKDVYDGMVAEHPHMSLDTVYRTLSLLEEHQVIEETQPSEGVAKYQLACVQSHHHHLICIACGKVSVLQSCPLSSCEMDLGGFLPVRHRFDVYGYCPACASV